ncbi:MAG: T9SS type A sorting domain-containing protein [Muribaculaceae bacterium]|nr:T9SS type A sorting domain-containing protein [Muribaculaceae bacterium]
MSKKLQRTLLGAALVATLSSSAATYQAPSFRDKETAPLSRMRKANPTQRWSGLNKLENRQSRIAPHFTSPASDDFQYLYGPDGSQWYAICNYDTEDVELEGGYATDHLKKGFTYTIYDSKFNEIGKVRDEIKFEGNEIRCAQVELSETVTKKFFRSDDKYEVMVSVSMNTPEHVNNERTYIYAIENLNDGEYSEVLNVLPGYPVDAIDVSKDRWGEDFYITFLTEKQADPNKDYPSYIDFLAEYKHVLTTYTKGGYNSDPKVFFEHEIRNLDLPGDGMTSPMMLCKKINGKLALIYAHYEKSFFVDPSGMGGNEAITPDNRLIIDVYQMNDKYPAEMELINSTKIETIQNTDNPNVYCTYYGIGTLSWDADVDYEGHYTNAGQPAFVITTDDYLFSDDDHYNSSYYVYDADGNRIKTIAENTFDYVKMSDIPGYEPQTMFVYTGDEMGFKFIDLYSCQIITETDLTIKEYGLSTSLDRVATADGYVYASALSTGLPGDDDDSTYAPVIWFDTDGEMIRLDKIPTGKGIELAQIYISSFALSPYVFNTDKEIEYMLLVKRNLGNSSPLQEELLIATPEKGAIYTFTPDKEKGEIRMVYLMEGKNPELVIVYLNDNKFIADSYTLPFTKFAGGNGTAEDPYLIATAGDLQQIKSAPSSYFKIISDIDCSGVSFSQIENFSGVLDGDGHVVSNLLLSSSSQASMFKFCDGATIKNINFYNTKMLLDGDSEAAILASTSSKTTFDNIHVRRLTARGENYGGIFGGICAKSWTYTNFTGCEVSGADIYLPKCNGAGGIVGDIRTSTTITACSFSGNMLANNTVGGIVGTTTTGDEVISNCHVDANLKAENTIGGIVGFLDRSKVKSNYVEGTIEATKASKWTNAISLGCIAGELEGDWQGNGDVPVVNNLIGVSSLKYPDQSDITEKYPHQLATVHRVVGRSSYNAEPEYDDVDSEGNPIYKNKVRYEEGILNNIVVSDLAVIDNDFAEKTLEGTTVDKDEVDSDMLTKTLEFEYGTSISAPWNLQSWYAYDPNLYYENVVFIPTPELTVKKDAVFNIEVAVLTRETLTEELVIEDFMCEFSEDLLEMTGNMTFDGKAMNVEFKAIKEGDAKISVSILGGTSTCNVKVVNDQNAVENVSAVSGALSYTSGILSAAGCVIKVFDMNGKLMLAGSDLLDASSLSAGVYVATAMDADGNKAAIKFVK